MLEHIFRMFRYGMSYFIATSFFGKDVRTTVVKLYSFVRVPDNIVDVVEGWFDIKSDKIYCENKECLLANKNNICNHRCRDMLYKHYINAFTKLTKHYTHRQNAYKKKDTKDKIFWEYVDLFYTHKISFVYSKSFFESMKMDCSMRRYENYTQLESYMYGSAAVIGLMMCELMGVDNPLALPYAKMLGDAMQLTNFLRDIKEDIIYLDRIYLPLQDLKKHGLDHTDIIGFANDFKHKKPEKRSAFKLFMKDYIKLSREMYAEAEEWFKYLPNDARRAVSLASLLYQGILDKIERHEYNVFSKTARTNIWDKTKIIAKWNIQNFLDNYYYKWRRQWV